MTARPEGTSPRPLRKRRGPLIPTIVIAVVLVVGFVLFAQVWSDVLWYQLLGFIQVFITQPTAGTTVSNTAWAVMWLEGSTAASKTYTLTLGGKAMGSITTASNGPV